MLDPSELILWQLVTKQFQLAADSIHGPSHWMIVRRNGLYLAKLHGADPEVVRLFAVCLDADRLDLGRVGIIPDPQLLSTTTAKDIATRQAWAEIQ